MRRRFEPAALIAFGVTWVVLFSGSLLFVAGDRSGIYGAITGGVLVSLVGVVLLLRRREGNRAT
jgi:uncharacterized membrane protein YgdD (TMEM256/DUF423 family)